MLKNVISKSNNTNINHEEYLQNQLQINYISKLLVEHAEVPKKLVDWLIEAVKDNTKFECKKNNDD